MILVRAIAIKTKFLGEKERKQFADDYQKNLNDGYTLDSSVSADGIIIYVFKQGGPDEKENKDSFTKDGIRYTRKETT